ncbi:DUF4282 domain-containing protein [Brachybacterium sp. UMB0905]|uniref:DUF4282 domain-containing protein n=1 Tax=Brachybacterium sp. UMB0905 TaxID=2069310 RepID=UPI000C808EC2|nr:DUF4282 domain-containing protein [Brachybacterium sp. UMB0905]PMC74889.1 hypothetical protein CJ197_11400 [Brachybacterium sp. UMB0905]
MTEPYENQPPTSANPVPSEQPTSAQPAQQSHAGQPAQPAADYSAYGQSAPSAPSAPAQPAAGAAQSAPSAPSAPAQPAVGSTSQPAPGAASGTTADTGTAAAGSATGTPSSTNTDGDPNMIQALFDFKFKHFVSLKYASVLYIVAIIVALLIWAAQVVGSLMFGAMLGALNSSWYGEPSFNAIPLLIALLLGWIPSVVALIGMRLAIEFSVASARTAQNTTAILEHLRR